MTTAPPTNPDPAIKDIYQYDDPIRVIADRIPLIEPKLNHRKFSELLGFKSPATLSHLFSARRKLTHDLAVKVAGILQLSASEQTFFCLITDFSNAKDPTKRSQYFAEMQKLRNRSNAYRVDQKGLDYFSHWYFPAILEFLLYNKVKEDYSLIGKSLYPQIAARDVKRAVERMIEWGLLYRNESGYLIHLGKPISAEGVPLSALRNRTKQLLENSIVAIDELSREHRHVSSATIAVSPQRYQQICEKLDELRHWVMDSDENQTDFDRVIHVSLSAIPLTQVEEINS